jgi:hypothetical protein
MDDDTRTRVPLNGKRIDLAQLATEVGAALTASETEVVVTDPGAKVTQVTLSKAVAAHTPPVRRQPVPRLTDDEVTRVRAMLAGR